MNNNMKYDIYGINIYIFNEFEWREILYNKIFDSVMNEEDKKEVFENYKSIMKKYNNTQIFAEIYIKNTNTYDIHNNCKMIWQPISANSIFSL
jgi:hypothetical protein